MTRFIFCFLIVNIPAFSQHPVWHDGVLVLSNNEVLRGKLSVECFHDLVLYCSASSTQVYPAHRVNRVYFYDAENNINRRFLTLTYPDSRSHLFEIVIQGAVSIVRQPHRHEVVHVEDHHAFDYFIIDEQDQIFPLSEFGPLYSQLCKKSDGMLKSLVQAQRISLTTKAGIISAILAYNSISANDHKTLARLGSGQ